MPYTEEDKDELLSLQNQVERERQTSNKLLDQIKAKNTEYANLKSSVRMIKLIAVLLGVAFFSLIGIILFKPDLLLGVPVIGGIEQLDSDKEVFAMKDSLLNASYKIDSLRKAVAGLPDRNNLRAEIRKEKKINDSLLKVLTAFQNNDKKSNGKPSASYPKEKTEYDRYFKTRNVYSVQIGAFKKLNLMLMSKNFVNFRGYQNKDYFIYSLGNFGTREEAERFKEKLIALGFKDAFVTPYKL